MPLEEYPLKNSIDIGIQYSASYAEYDACLACNLDLWKWATDEYPHWFKVLAFAIHKTRTAIESHREDAIQIAQEKRSRKGKRG